MSQADHIFRNFEIEIFSPVGLDSPNQPEPTAEFRFFAHAIVTGDPQRGPGKQGSYARRANHLASRHGLACANEPRSSCGSVSEVAAVSIEARSVRHTGQDLLGLRSSHFDAPAERQSIKNSVAQPWFVNGPGAHSGQHFISRRMSRDRPARSMKRPMRRFRWKPSKSPKLSFGLGELAAITAVLALVAAFLVFYVMYPPPFKLTSSSLGPDWDCAPDPASWGPACVKRISPAK